MGDEIHTDCLVCGGSFDYPGPPDPDADPPADGATFEPVPVRVNPHLEDSIEAMPRGAITIGYVHRQSCSEKVDEVIQSWYREPTPELAREMYDETVE